eukprot:12906257-Prorocentrum_lima.AAC.1
MPWFELNSRREVTAMFHIYGTQLDSRNSRGRQQDIVVAQEEFEALSVDGLLQSQEYPYWLPVVYSFCKFSN